MAREGTNGYRIYDPYFLGVIRSLAESAAGSQCTILSLTAKKTFAALHQPLRLRINEKSLRTALQILD